MATNGNEQDRGRGADPSNGGLGDAGRGDQGVTGRQAMGQTSTTPDAAPGDEVRRGAADRTTDDATGGAA